MSDDTPTKAPVKTRAEELRERFFWRNQWHRKPREVAMGDLYRIEPDRDALLVSLNDAEINQETAQKALKAARVKLDNAQKAFDKADREYREARDLTDVYKMAIASAIGVPR